ncbi:MAG: hypothetical protein JNM84_28000 [Planctomycetes bacterium]|nr:hypothetical protein [Planctomycetota bacterium]
MNRTKRRIASLTAFACVGLAAPCHAMPGGFGGGPGFFAVLLAFLGMVAGYGILFLKAASESLRSGPHRQLWTIVLYVLLAFGIACICIWTWAWPIYSLY